jgi:hypothetical protein
MTRALLLIAALALVAGCGQTQTSGTVHQPARIPAGERIVVVWTTGLFVDPFIHERMSKDGTYGRAYESCTNAWIERTFKANGYTASARRIAAGEQPALPRDTRYVLAILNRSARTMRQNNLGAPLGFGTIILEMDVELGDRLSRTRLWTGKEAFFTDARRNAGAVVRIVRGLAADGFLARRPEEVVDQAGRLKSDDDLPACAV